MLGRSMEGLSDFGHQVAGHGDLQLSKDGKWLYKPYTLRECQFYLNTENNIWKTIRPQASCSVGDDFLRIENLTRSMSHPSVCDIKLGSRQHTGDMDESKIKYCLHKCETSTSLRYGFRITGYKVTSSSSIIQFQKAEAKRFGTSLESTAGALKSFLRHPEMANDDLLEMLNSLTIQISTMKQCFESSRMYLPYSASLLICYDMNSPQTVVAKMIDFSQTICIEEAVQDGHVSSRHEADNDFSSFTTGLNSIITIVRNLIGEIERGAENSTEKKDRSSLLPPAD